MKKEKKFAIPEMLIIEFCNEDIVTTSGGENDAGGVDADEVFN